jgi:hypothetical protein
MNILTVNLVLSTIVFAIAAKLYLIPELARLEPRTVVLPILLLHALRHLGLVWIFDGLATTCSWQTARLCALARNGFQT